MKTYKGIELDNLSKKVSLAYSRFFGADEGVDWTKTLLDTDKTMLMPGQFRDISSLNSVLNFNYQVCNGGLLQYFANRYYKVNEHLERLHAVLLQGYGDALGQGMNVERRGTHPRSPPQEREGAGVFLR